MTPEPLAALFDAVKTASQAFAGTEASLVRAPINGQPSDVVRLSFPPSTSLYFLPSPFFPEAPPALCIQWGDESEREFRALEWPLDGEPAQKIVSALKTFIASSDRYTSAYGAEPDLPLSLDPDIAQIAGWKRLLTGAPLSPSAPEIAAERIDPALVAALAGANILIVGLGSVGSYMAEQFARTGIGALGLIDHDRVEPANLSRTAYEQHDIGLTKADALARKLLNISPEIRLDICPLELQAIGPEPLRALFASADLIIAATDDPAAQAQINSCAQFADKPAIFVGLYRGAKGGEVSISVPGLTPCFRCQVGAIRLAAARNADTSAAIDYGTGRLQGEMALACDIQHVSSAAIKIAISLLAALKSVDGPISQFTLGAIQRNMHILTLAMDPDWWIFPELFQDTPAQYTYQSMWVTAQPQVDCPDCSPTATRIDPFPRLARVDISSLRRLLDTPEPPAEPSP